MPDTFTKVTSESWSGRIGHAFKGVLVGLLLFVLAFPLLFWNEGRAVKRARTLKEGGGAVVSVDSAAVDPANEGKLVHATGQAVTSETLTDPVFGVTVAALKLRRDVEMYQWQERAESKTRKVVGGGTETTTTYTYEKGWSPRIIDASAFEEPAGHENPGRMRFPSDAWTAGKVTLGGFVLTPSLVGRIDRYAPLQAPSPDLLPESLRGQVHPYAGGYFLGRDPASPAVGDLRVAFHSVPPTDVSIISRQVGDTFEPYRASAGGTLELLQLGTHSSEAMIEQAVAANQAALWMLRAIGFVVMLLGLGLMLKPLSVMADVVPLIGRIVGAGTGLIAFLVALGLSTVTIAIAWLVYRPLVGIGLLAAAGVVGFLIVRALRKHAPAPATAGPGTA